MQQVVRLLAENKADVHVDPLLHRACALDIKHYCFDIPPGEGRRKYKTSCELNLAVDVFCRLTSNFVLDIFSEMSCLLAALYDKTVRLKAECRKMLDERVTMWEYAAKVRG